MQLNHIPPVDLDMSVVVGGRCTDHPIRVAVCNFYEEITTQGYIFKNVNVSIGHDLLRPWVDLFHYGQLNGIHFVTPDEVDQLEDLDAIIFIDRPRQDSAIALRLMQSNTPKYLLLYEPEVVKPDNWDTSYHKLFRKVFTWNDDLIDDIHYFKTNFSIVPSSIFDLPELVNSFNSRKLCTMIAGYKASPHPNELYSHRIKFIRWFEVNAPEDFDLYGVGWNSSDFPSYSGMVINKPETLVNYRFAICYENAINSPGYISEKILDCFRSGVIPVYLGAPNVSRWIPSDCFIARQDFNSEASLYAFLKAMNANEHAAYLERIDAFLQSPACYPFSIEYFICTITSLIVKDTLTQREECPLVSIVIPTYNYGDYIFKAIQSVLDQDIHGLEVLIFDNASSDQTQIIVEKYFQTPTVRYMRNSRNIGAQQNWRNTIINACGRYVAILSADDWFLHGHIRRMVECMESNANIALSYSPCVWVDADGNTLQIANHIGHAISDYQGGRDEFAHLLSYDCFITPSAALIRREALEHVGNFDMGLHGAIDWDLWIRISEKFADFAFFKIPGVSYRRHEAQDTKRLNKSALLLTDHLTILERAIQRGTLVRGDSLAENALKLLDAKFNSYPIEFVAHLRARFDALKLSLNTGQIDLDIDQLASISTTISTAFQLSFLKQLDIIDLINAAELLQKCNRHDIATILYRLWISQTQSDLEYIATFNLATLLHLTGDLTEAVRFYKKTLQLRPTFTQASQRLNQLN